MGSKLAHIEVLFDHELSDEEMEKVNKLYEGRDDFELDWRDETTLWIWISIPEQIHHMVKDVFGD